MLAVAAAVALGSHQHDATMEQGSFSQSKTIKTGQPEDRALPGTKGVGHTLPGHLDDGHLAVEPVLRASQTGPRSVERKGRYGFTAYFHMAAKCLPA